MQWVENLGFHGAAAVLVLDFAVVFIWSEMVVQSNPAAVVAAVDEDGQEDEITSGYAEAQQLDVAGWKKHT